MKVLIISNMYPDINNPSYGVFVKRFCEQLEEIHINYEKVVLMKKKKR